MPRLSPKSQKPAKRASGAPATVTKIADVKQTRARVELMRHPDLKRTYVRLQKLVGDGVRAEGLVRYEIGAEVASALRAPKKYGKRSVETLADLLSFDDSTLRDYARVAKTWSKSEVTATLRKLNSASLPLRFSHLVLLSKLSNVKRRNELFARCLSEALSVRQLQLVLNEGDAPPALDADEPGVRERRQAVAWFEQEAAQIDRKTDDLIDYAQKNAKAAVYALLDDCVKAERDLAAKAAESAAKLEAALAELRKPGQTFSGRSEKLRSSAS